jgi:hypothetical protein
LALGIWAGRGGFGCFFSTQHSAVSIQPRHLAFGTWHLVRTGWLWLPRLFFGLQQSALSIQRGQEPRRDARRPGRPEVLAVLDFRMEGERPVYPLAPKFPNTLLCSTIFRPVNSRLSGGIPLMLRHAIQFLETIISVLLAALSTSMLSVIVFSILVPLSMFGAVVLYKWLSGEHSKTHFVQSIKESVKAAYFSASIPFAAWALLFAWATLVSVYHDHQNLAGRLRAVVNEKEHLKDGVAVRDRYINRLTQSIDGLAQQVEMISKGRRVNTSAGANAAGETHQCWLESHFESPNPHQPSSKSATSAIMHCNYRIESPFYVAVKFDREFLYGNVVIPSAGVVMGGSGGKMPGNVFYSEITAPSIPANQLIIVIVEAPTETYPRALSGEVKSK